MDLIVAVGADWGIGKEGDLLFSIPEDMKYFRTMTQGKVVVMGRKTLESLPGGKPLKNRTNLVLSQNPDYTVEDAQVCQSIDEVRKAVRAYAEDDVMVIGGAGIYRALLPYCKRAYVTHVDAIAPADTYFPDLTKEPGWALAQTGEPQEHEGLRYRFCMYENSAVKA